MATPNRLPVPASTTGWNAGMNSSRLSAARSSATVGPSTGASRARRVRRDGLREASKLLRALLVQWIMEQY
ncbi:Uncharacterised protein [Bordetella pertussis]|nr:Uncharacterised protein [Bordetella pertussis]